MLRALVSLLALALAAVVACGSPPPPQAPISFDRGPDLDARTLPPNEEIDVLLKGGGGAHVGRNAARVAVPPLKVSGPAGNDWMGEAVAELVATGLSQRGNVSVLQRGEMLRLIQAIKREQDNDAREAVRVGKLLLAEHVIVGSVLPSASDRLVVTLAPVRVADGVRLPTSRTEIAGDDWARALSSAIDKLASDVLGEVREPVEPAQPLDRASLELASRARQLQYEGKLLEAQPLYERALAKPSSAWRFEADYLRLMWELGMAEWVRDRAPRVLARMPMTRDTMCDRARMVIQGKSEVGRGRDAVRAAAECRDPSVIAEALVHYGWAMESVDYDAARAAFSRALDLVSGARQSAWIRCVALEELYRLFADEGDWQGSRREHFEENARQCADAGNLRLAAVATGNAALFAERPEERLALQAKRAELARAVGSWALDNAAVAHANELRRQGKLTEAEAKLLELLRLRLKAVIDVYAGLPSAEARLDDELLRRAGVTRPATPPKDLAGPAKLIGQAHRVQLASAVRAWAERTTSDSKRQADVYRAIADDIDPPEHRDPPDATEEQKLEKQLERTKLPLKLVASMNDAPPRGAGMDVYGAASTLDDMFWSLRRKKAPEAQLREVLAALRKTASWVKTPRARRWSIRDDARLEADLGNVEAARGILKTSLVYAKDDPEWQSAVLDFDVELLKRSQPKEAYEAAKRRIELAKRISPTALEAAIYNAAYVGWDTKQLAFDEGITSIVDAAGRFREAKDWESAAAAFAHAAQLDKYGHRADGTRAAVEFQRQRVAVLDQIGDPLRSTLARADLANETVNLVFHSFRKMTKDRLRDDPEAIAAMADLRARLDALVQEGRVRDAARVVGSLSTSLPGVDALVRSALKWSESFSDSAEYAALAAKLHWALSALVEHGAAERAELAITRDLFLKAKDDSTAMSVEQQLIAAFETEADAWAEYDKCAAILQETRTAWVESCAWGIGAFIVERSMRATDKAKLAVALKAGRDAMAFVDRSYGPDGRARFRMSIAGIAACAEDFAAFDAIAGEVRTYYTVTEPSPYMWASSLLNVAYVLAAVDPKRALPLFKEFDAAGGSSEFWRADIYYAFANVARLAGDPDAERDFLTRGRRYAIRANVKDVYYYDRYTARLLAKAKDWKALEPALELALDDATRYMPREVHLIRALPIYVGIARALRRDYGGARRAMFDVLKSAQESAMKGAPPASPCQDARALEVAGAIEMAAGSCARGAQLRKLAENARAQCTRRQCVDIWCDGPGDIEWRGQNACFQPVAETAYTTPDL